MEPYSDTGEILIRLEHIYEADEDETLSAPVHVSLAVRKLFYLPDVLLVTVYHALLSFVKELFKGFDITSLEETVLGGNMWNKELNRLKWNAANGEETKFKNSSRHFKNSEDISNGNIVLHPMQIRSFILQTALKL